MSRIITAFVVFLCSVGFSSPALAEWRVVESDHFVIYADDKEKNLQKFAEMLESYHSAMEFVSGR